MAYKKVFGVVKENPSMDLMPRVKLLVAIFSPVESLSRGLTRIYKKNNHELA